MKIFTIVITVIALVLIAFNITQINFSSPFEGESIVALITIFAALCAILIVFILLVSKRIEQKVKGQK